MRRFTVVDDKTRKFCYFYPKLILKVSKSTTSTTQSSELINKNGADPHRIDCYNLGTTPSTGIRNLTRVLS